MNKFMNDISDFVKQLPFSVTRISEYKNGKIETAEFEQANPCQNTYSVAKAFTMTAVGLLYDKKMISVNDKVCDILHDEFIKCNADERWKKSTVDFALTHKLGLPVGFLDIDCNKSSGFTSDFLKYMFEYPLESEPGTVYMYSDGAFYLLSRIVEKISGMKVDDFLWQNLLLQLDFQEAAWSHCPQGHPIGATGLYIHSSDMVKLGALYLNNGVYSGERLLSEEWVKLAVEHEYAFEWDETHTLYKKGGMCGQKLFVCPSQDRAVAMQSYGGNSNVIEEYLLNYKD